MADAWQDGAIDGVVVRPLVRRTDARGWLAEVFRQDELPPALAPVMSYVSVTRPGVTRGPHAHRDQTDLFAFLGPGRFRLWLWDARPDSSTHGRRTVCEGGDGQPTVVVVPPGVVHAYRNVAAVDGWVVNCPNRLFAGPQRREPVDEVRYEQQADHPFSMED